jgi:hypothetical protein
METAKRVDQLSKMPMNQVPKEAQQLVNFMSAKYGFSGEVALAAYEAYAIVIGGTVGGVCSTEERRFLEAIKQN